VSEPKRGSVLLVAADAELRQRYRRLLAEDRPVLAIAPEQLADPTAFVDARVAVVCLDEASAEASSAALAPLERLHASRALLLVACRLPDEVLERALRRLAPAQLLLDPAPASALRFALARLDPDGGAQSGRAEHRPALALLGVSRAIRDVLDEIGRVAPARASVLILGETGTGKELVARAIHARSPRADHPFVALNCGALPESLLEAELFGFRKGAFTGAERAQPGLFRAATGGTLFLDEVGDMPFALQTKLLRVLESGEVRPLGDTSSVEVDVRLVSATNRNLEQAIEEGAFREDLYYRINAVTIRVPPLRRRRVDIPFLAQHFAEQLGADMARRVVLGEDFLDALGQRDFRGNVRELRNLVERAIAMAAPGESISVDHLPDDRDALPPLHAMGELRDRVAQLELQAIRAELDRWGGNRTQVARVLGLTRQGLRKKMKRLGID
jgi:transcriptional regulator with PAS, ATPase and Fis domain